MPEPEALEGNKTTPEESSEKRRQVWLTLLVMLASSCVGMSALAAVLWLLFKKVIPPGWL